MASMHDYMRRRAETNGAVERRLNRIDTELANLDDTVALEVTALYPAWTTDVSYTADERVQYGEKLYRCVQSHTSQADWTPDATPALWAKVAKPGEIPVWKQPTGAQDSYMAGDKVHYPDEGDPVYVSAVDNNVWSPIDYPQWWQRIE